uniref:Uncharacterized protein n=1 Tax=Panagrolaimus superbus TaxID=310955 RepID=A0A914YUK5_9BILA
MHKELNRKSLYQTITPTVSFLILLITCAGMFMEVTENTGEIVIAMMSMQYITVFNPFITIFTIQCYRKAFTRKNTVTVSMSVSVGNRYHYRF